MSARNVSLSTMFSWIAGSFRLVARGPGTLVASAALTVLVFIAISIPMWLGMGSILGSAAAGAAAAGTNPLAGGMTAFLVAYLITILLSLIVFPPITVGWFRILRALDAGQPARATMLFDGYRDAWLRSVLLSLLGFAGVVLAAIVLGLALAGAISSYMQAATAAQAAALAGGQAAPVLPSASLVLGYFFFLFLMMLWQFACSLALGDVALRGAGPVGALAQGVAATGRNVHKLLLFGVILLVALFAFALVLALVLGALLFALSMLGETASVIAMVLLYIPAVLLMYPLAFAAMYVAWKSMLGDAPSDAPAAPELVAA